MSVRIAFLGDTLLGSKATATLGREGYPYALDGLRPLLADADLVVANHEGPVTRDAPTAAKTYGPRTPSWRRADPESLDALVEAGVRVVGLGNNHMLDHGEQGLADTLDHLDAAGIRHCGAGPDAATAVRGVDVTVRGESLHVVSAMEETARRREAGYYADASSGGPALLDPPALGPALAAATGLPVALPHWGQGYGPVDAGQRRLAAELVQAGAGLVVGTGPHVPQPVAVIDDVVVLFALGNGAYGSLGRFAKKNAPPYGLVATVEVHDARVTALELHLTLVDNKLVHFRPRPVVDPTATEFLRGLLDPTLTWRSIPGGFRSEWDSRR